VTGAVRAVAGGTATDGLVSSQVVKLVNGGFGMAGWNKTKVVLGVLLLGGLLAVAGAVAPRTDEQPPPTPNAAAAPEKPPPNQRHHRSRTG